MRLTSKKNSFKSLHHFSFSQPINLLQLQIKTRHSITYHYQRLQRSPGDKHQRNGIEQPNCAPKGEIHSQLTMQSHYNQRKSAPDAPMQLLLRVHRSIIHSLTPRLNYTYVRNVIYKWAVPIWGNTCQLTRFVG